jgi:hypothetical protein
MLRGIGNALDLLRRYVREPTNKIAIAFSEPMFRLHIVAALETRLP